MAWLLHSSDQFWVIATLGLISNSTAVVIGAMIVAPLMDPLPNLAFGLADSNGKLIRRSAVTVGFGVLAVMEPRHCLVGGSASAMCSRRSPEGRLRI